jgi:hypothetical protein
MPGMAAAKSLGIKGLFITFREVGNPVSQKYGLP